MEMERTKLYQDFLTGRQPEVGCKQGGYYISVVSIDWMNPIKVISPERIALFHKHVADKIATISLLWR